MKDRLKLLRKSLGITQQEFADRIGIKRNSYANYETGRNTPIDAIILSICREFKVNEEWLRTGTGGDDNIFVKTTPYDKAYNRFGYIMENSIPSKKAALAVLLELVYSMPDDQWESLVDLYHSTIQEAKGED